MSQILYNKMVNYIYMLDFDNITTKQDLALTRICLNSGLSIRYASDTYKEEEGSYYIGLDDGWIIVGRNRPGLDGETVYMHHERLVMDADKVGHIQLPLKEIMAMGMEDKGAYKPSGKQYLVDHVNSDQTIRGISFRGFPDMPTTCVQNVDDVVSALASDEPIGILVPCRSFEDLTKQDVDD